MGGGLVYLALLVGPAAAGVTGATAGLYLFAYTPAKRRTWLCTPLGAVPGALPPVTGWVAARGELGAGALALFAILFFWQLPHTLAIARLYREDYARGGIRVLPVVEGAGRATECGIIAGCVGLLGAALLPTVAGLAGWIYLGGALVLGGALLACGLAEAAAPSSRTARRLILASIGYLPALLVLMALDKAG
jgi:protoheme IX farnesyltransferase